MNEIFDLIGKIVIAGGGISLIVYQVFKHLAARWLEDKFKKNFQQLVHDQNKEIERLKSGLTKSFDRATKLHQREFETLPQIWDKVSEAYWSAASLVSPHQMHHDLNKMFPKQLSFYIEQSGLAEWQKDEVMASSDKTKKFKEINDWYKLSRSLRAHHEANIALSRTGIFVEDTIKEKLQAVLNLVRGALIEYEMNIQHPSDLLRDRDNKDICDIRTDGKIWMDDAEKLIKARIWEH